jgi:FtsH-binding integral membrane protein
VWWQPRAAGQFPTREVVMNQADFRANTPYAELGNVVAAAPEEARRTFIRKTYTHLAAAIYAFVMLEWLFVQAGLDQKALELIGQSRFMWLAVLGGFMAISWVADSWAQSATSIGKQYAGLFLYVLGQAVIFLPMIGIAKFMTINAAGQEIPIIGAAGLTTVVMVAGLTAYAFLTKQDFSFLGGFLNIVGWGAFALIGVSILFGFNLGVWFSAAMVIFAAGYILYYTSNILHTYNTNQYVAAALALFASVALLFWYILRIFMSFSSRD